MVTVVASFLLSKHYQSADDLGKRAGGFDDRFARPAWFSDRICPLVSAG
jgi:hypothetical protein